MGAFSITRKEATMLKAFLTRTDKLTSKGYKYLLTCPDLGLTVEDHVPSHALCREIVKHHPERANESLEIYRSDQHAMTIRNIKGWSELATSEQDRNGLQTVPYRPFPKIA